MTRQGENLAIWRTEALVPRLESYLSNQINAAVTISDLSRFTAGLSWITISFGLRQDSAEARQLILRIGDPNGLLAPYSAWPEFVALSCLDGIPELPIPQPYWCCDDAEVIGAPFMIVGHLQGTTLMPMMANSVLSDAGDQCHSDDRSLIEQDFAAALSAIHGCAWGGTDVAGLTPGVSAENCTLLEIERWTRHAAGSSGTLEDSAMRFADAWLRAHAPVAPEVVLLHGDYRVGNFLVHEGRISGILDWELTHLGDPHEDLAWAGMRAFGGTDTTLSGLLGRQAFYHQYEQRSGRRVDPAALRYFEVLGQYKQASMLIGAEERVRKGSVHDIRLAAMALQRSAAMMGLMSMIKAVA
ncbi:phosphotransferase family protein [Alloalcanivorax mobilis]|uniref:phosphotransferase family protein n=1 Tax=Alloalcanivorax mobilis TaxID=2019569 RepID=UPI000C7890C5|nr:phosphotransferase family protein [Alloalcanivorax mobilis]|tara:strand:- start:16219 stop:17286 length:1068 start_codon:yes stop_codon:yes gene_type:complete